MVLSKVGIFLKDAEDMYKEDRKITNNITANLEITIVNSLTHTKPKSYCNL